MSKLGKYEVLESLATGGMAEIFLARQSGLHGFNKTVVLKRLHPNLSQDPEVVRMFIDEARIASRLIHPNIAQIFDLGAVDGNYFITMEHIDGHDLRDIQDRELELGLQMPYPVVAYIISCVCRGLHYAHTLRDATGRPLNVVHRDVSPQNILVSFEGDVKLVDFGIAKAASRVAETQAGLLRGKVGYMSPEQCQSLPVDARSDVFSVGIVLYELACRRRLFRRQSEFATMRALIKDPIPPPSAVSDDVPDELEAIIMRALMRNLDDRYQSVQQMQEDLEAAVLCCGWQVDALTVAEHLRRVFPERAEQELAPAAWSEGEEEDLPTPAARSAAARSAAARSAVPHSPLVGSSVIGDEPYQEEATVIGAPDFADIVEEAAGEDAGVPAAAARAGLDQVPTREEPLAAGKVASRPPPVPRQAPRASLKGASAGVTPQPSVSAPLPALPQDSAAATPATPRDGQPALRRAKAWWVLPLVLGAVAVAAAVLTLLIVHSLRPKAPQAGMVKVSSRPAGAAVHLDGRPCFGTTPLVVREVSFEEQHTLVVVLDGYRPWNTRFKLTQQQSERAFSPRLMRSEPAGPPATVVIEANQREATVYLDGELQGQAPVTVTNVAVGSKHTIVVKKEGFDDAVVTLDGVRPGERRVLTIPLVLSQAKLLKGIEHGKSSAGKGSAEEESGPVIIPRAQSQGAVLRGKGIGERVPQL